MTAGLYLLANDHVRDWMLACLNSIRELERELPIAVVPFDGRTSKIERDLAPHGVEILHGDFSFYDELGHRLCPNPRGAHAFRKFACFSGPFDPFVYLDVDTVLLEPLAPFLRAWPHSGADVVVADLDPTEVYEPGPLRDKTRGFNGGFFLSRVDLLDEKTLADAADEAELVKQQFVGRNLEQPFMNFCADTLGWRIATLAEVCPGTASNTWAKGPLEAGMPFVHWAGFGLSPKMPHRSLWMSKRLASASLRDRASLFLVPKGGRARGVARRARSMLTSRTAL